MFHKVFYTDRFIPDGYAGYTRAMFVFIRPNYRDDLGLLRHELTHVHQFYRRPFVHGLMYIFSKNYRLQCEVEAYREQMRYYNINRSDLFALYLSRDYDLDITFEKARDLLNEEKPGS